MNIKRIIRYFFLHLQHLPMNSVGIRPLLCKWGGVKIKSPRHTFIGEDVRFDTLYPEKILIEQGVVITAGTLILSHFVLSPKPDNKDIAVHIKEYAFNRCSYDYLQARNHRPGSYCRGWFGNNKRHTRQRNLGGKSCKTHPKKTRSEITREIDNHKMHTYLFY